MQLEGKRAIVTGARQGIGRAIAEALAREGCDVGINDIELGEAAQETKRLVEAHGRRGHLLRCDISDAASVETMFAEFTGVFGGIDILVNNAAIVAMHHFLKLTEDDWDQVMATTLKGPFLCSQAAARDMVTGGAPDPVPED